MCVRVCACVRAYVCKPCACVCMYYICMCVFPVTALMVETTDFLLFCLRNARVLAGDGIILMLSLGQLKNTNRKLKR